MFNRGEEEMMSAITANEKREWLSAIEAIKTRPLPSGPWQTWRTPPAPSFGGQTPMDHFIGIAMVAIPRLFQELERLEKRISESELTRGSE